MVERGGRVKSRNRYRGPMGMDNGLEIDCGGAGKSKRKNLGQL